MSSLIKDYRVRKSFSFGMYDAALDREIVANLLATRALYCYVDKDFNLIRFKDGKLDETKVNYSSDKYKTTANFRTDSSNMDEFEEHYLAHIAGEKMFRDFFFSDDIEYKDEYMYFIFQPYIISLEKDKDYFYRIYPVVKIINDETVVIDFNYYPRKIEESVEEFSNRLIRISDEIQEVKFPYPYFSALDLEIIKENGEFFRFEANETAIFSSEFFNFTNFFEIAEMFLSLLFKFKKYSYFGRSVLSLDNIDLSEEDINLIRNGFLYSEANPLYVSKMIDFSEHKDKKFYVFEHMTLTMGDVLESFLPALVIDEEISILNTKLLVYSKIEQNESIKGLLDAKEALEKLKQQIQYKYSKILVSYTIMDYAIHKIFHIDKQIERIDSLIEIYFRKQEYVKNEKENIFQFFIGERQ